MIAPTDTRSGTWTSLWRRELALTPARGRAIARIAAASALMVAVAMTFQIPLPAYAAYLVFVASQEDVASTLITSIGGIVAASLAIGLSILLYVFDASEPALRLPLLALSAFAGSFFARTSALGPIAFLAGYVLVLTQTLADDIPATDPLVHEVLWLWVVVTAPVVITAVMNLLFGESPVALSRRRAADIFERVASQVGHPGTDDSQQLRAELLALDQLKNKAFLWDKRLKPLAIEDEALIAALLEVLSVARVLDDDAIEVRRHAAASIREAGRVFTRRRAASTAARADIATTLPLQVADVRGVALLQASARVLNQAQGGDATNPPQAPAARHGFFVPDAFSNRAHARFALKVMIAVLASYATYTLLDWPGIRTSVTTCFFVSLTTFGESVHKFTLRASGAIIGGLIAGLCIVFVLPLLTDIGELCVLIATVSAFAAWIATGSELVSYAGMQIAFAFFLGVLQGYAPATDLTGLRDRVVGILIGNLWVTLVFASIWPVSAAEQAAVLRIAALKKISQLLRQAEPPTQEQQVAVSQDLAHADVLQARAQFEWRRLPIDSTRQASPGSIERIASHAFALLRIRASTPPIAPSDGIDDALADRIDALCETNPSPQTRSTTDATPQSPLDRARQQLEEDITHATHPT
ncbi:FUSC family protein [Dyella japonica]|uniref:Multidrug resistance protein MdtO n=1 Tax=Dyella japonica TaxID=231455 RepID=A0ABV2JNZ8_9GAMM